MQMHEAYPWNSGEYPDPMRRLECAGQSTALHAAAAAAKGIFALGYPAGYTHVL